LKASFGEQEMN